MNNYLLDVIASSKDSSSTAFGTSDHTGVGEGLFRSGIIIITIIVVVICG